LAYASLLYLSTKDFLKNYILKAFLI